MSKAPLLLFLLCFLSSLQFGFATHGENASPETAVNFDMGGLSRRSFPEGFCVRDGGVRLSSRRRRRQGRQRAEHLGYLRQNTCYAPGRAVGISSTWAPLQRERESGGRWLRRYCPKVF